MSCLLSNHIFIKVHQLGRPLTIYLLKITRKLKALCYQMWIFTIYLILLIASPLFRAQFSIRTLVHVERQLKSLELRVLKQFLYTILKFVQVLDKF